MSLPELIDSYASRFRDLENDITRDLHGLVDQLGPENSVIAVDIIENLRKAQLALLFRIKLKDRNQK